jgi:hypothetical protein
MKRVPIVLFLAAALAACGTSTGFSNGTDGGSTITLRVQTAGGFVPPGADQASFPEWALTGDGRVVTTGPQIDIYPGPAMPNTLQRSITREGIDAITNAARDAGLLDDKHYDYGGVADAGTTFFTLVVDGTRHVVSAYALGMDAPGGPGENAADKDARAKLQRFRDKLGDLATWLPTSSLGEERAYEFDALRVVSREGQENPEDSLKPGHEDWPLSTPLATFGEATGDTRCGIVTGADLDKLLPKARTANSATLWHSGGKTYVLQFRPQLPDEKACEVPSAPAP